MANFKIFNSSNSNGGTVLINTDHISFVEDNTTDKGSVYMVMITKKVHGILGTQELILKFIESKFKCFDNFIKEEFAKKE